MQILYYTIIAMILFVIAVLLLGRYIDMIYDRRYGFGRWIKQVHGYNGTIKYISGMSCAEIMREDTNAKRVFTVRRNKNTKPFPYIF